MIQSMNILSERVEAGEGGPLAADWPLESSAGRWLLTMTASVAEMFARGANGLEESCCVKSKSRHW